MTMYDTMVTLVGNAATAVEHRQTPAGVSMVWFRLATSTRRWDKERCCWVDGDTSFYTVRAWRTLADNVAASVSRGEPLVVHGRMRVWDRELPEDKGGQRRVSVEVDAVAVGHDLTRGTSAWRRVVRPRMEAMVPSADGWVPEGRAPAPPTPHGSAPQAPLDRVPNEPDWTSPEPAVGPLPGTAVGTEPGEAAGAASGSVGGSGPPPRTAVELGDKSPPDVDGRGVPAAIPASEAAVVGA
ncbi:single-stranded DNA-binding protein [Streptomyces rimosus]|uniref:single-stranded DNA-binding protein n=1 Tax=Streptomyces rimosus TaxID=1927 RepID=UPI002D21DA3C|nr:single-stranded DNA-binding protein [Streptomyces rimosus]